MRLLGRKAIYGAGHLVARRCFWATFCFALSGLMVCVLLQVGAAGPVHHALGEGGEHDLPAVVQPVEDHRHQDQAAHRRPDMRVDTG